MMKRRRKTLYRKGREGRKEKISIQQLAKQLAISKWQSAKPFHRKGREGRKEKKNSSLRHAVGGVLEV